MDQSRLDIAGDAYMQCLENHSGDAKSRLIAYCALLAPGSILLKALMAGGCLLDEVRQCRSEGLNGSVHSKGFRCSVTSHRQGCKGVAPIRRISWQICVKLVTGESRLLVGRRLAKVQPD